MDQDPGEITQLLSRYRQGDSGALERLISLLYKELRKLAAYHMRAERADHTLQPTALVHEVYLRLAGHSDPECRDRAHFLALAAQVMRHVLVDHARSKGRAKRGGEIALLGLDEAAAVASARSAEVLALDDALAELERLDERRSRVVELRYFGGLTTDEIAEVLDVSPATVQREWTFARAWLRGEMEGGARP